MQRRRRTGLLILSAFQISERHGYVHKKPSTVTSIPVKIDKELEEVEDKVKDARTDFSKFSILMTTPKPLIGG